MRPIRRGAARAASQCQKRPNNYCRETVVVQEAIAFTEAASERLFALTRRLARQAEFQDVAAALSRGETASVDGVWGSCRALVAAALADHCQGVLVAVCSKSEQIDDLADDLRLFTPHACDRFPAWQVEQRDQVVFDEIYGDRLRAIKTLLGGQPPSILVTSIQSLLQTTPTPQAVAANTRNLRVGRSVDVGGLLTWLTENGFHATSAVELPGEFSSRGGILDVFAADWVDPVRIEFFGDEIESLRTFDVVTQRQQESLAEIDLSVESRQADASGALTEFLPAGSRFLLLEPEGIDQEGRHFLQRLENPELCHTVSDVFRQCAKSGSVSLSQLAASEADAHYRLEVDSVERMRGGIEHVRSAILETLAENDVYLACPTDAEAHRLREIFSAAPEEHSQRLHYVLGSLSEGFHLAGERAVLVGSGELFGRTDLRRTARRQRSQPIKSLIDLRQGDLVVHLAHGVGRCQGLTLLEKDGRHEEHLEIEFRDRVKIFVPVAKIDLVQKYIGGSKSRPPLAKIGGSSWIRQKESVEGAITDLAQELLEVNAQRATRAGVALRPDTEWQQEFDASFPYQETTDQLTAIADIKADQQAAQSMDRLLCGDVGYGKTEVAMRAAFKAIDNGYQVALLAPTTILAEQHFHTFSQRMAEFPFDIGKLSRFCSTREMRKTLKGLAEGRVDIAIGTHRLASQDVKFHNLGLVIIDEEQRFGVAVKERLRSLRAAVDVLTLSATPIPRTLHMALVGMRDISNLETPPEERVPVETRVTRFSNDLIRRAILRELNRGGQVFFVHNRVHDIQNLALKLQSLVPEADIRVGHGQMHESDLEQVMVDFVAGRFNVLLATTIVESGLDIPNANTIFIDNAHQFGLADLHQLRGRVGRYKHRAYCYLLLEPHKHLTPTAAKRLRAIEEFSDMGAGFAIAMRDLEIRGAGNLLGSQQSGHIAAVGYELYCQLLETAVRRLKKMPPKLSIDVDVALPGEAYLPRDYVPDQRSKIDLYRRLALIDNVQMLADFRIELRDRCGPPPPQTVRLLAMTELKLDAATWQLESLRIEGRYLVLGYTQRRRIEQLAKLRRGQLRVVDDENAYLDIPKDVTSDDDFIAWAKSVLQMD